MCFVVYGYMTHTSELQLQAAFETESELLCRATASMLGCMVKGGDVNAIARVAPQILRMPDTERLAIIGADGQILISFPDSALMSTPGSAPTGIVRSPGSLAVSAEIPGGGRLLIERSVNRLHAEMTKSHAEALELSLVLAVMGALVAWVLSAQVVTPIRRLTRAVTGIGEGQYQKVKVPHQNDEISTLAKHFNLMVDEIEAKTHSLEEANRDLRHEILDRRMIACALEESQERLHFVLANAPIVIFALDRNGVFTLSEGQALQEIKSRPASTVGRSVQEVYAEHPRILQNAERALAGQAFSDEVDLDGKTFEVHYSPCRDDDGTPNGVIGIAMDITARKRFEHERNQLQERLAEAQKMEAVGNLAGGFAHSFNNLLVGIMGHADLLRENGKGPEQVHKSSDAIYHAAERASILTQQLLGFAGRGRFQSTKVDVHQTIENCLSLLGPTLVNGIHVSREYGAVNRTIVGDPAQIEQMLLNLIKNACEAMPEGGTLTLRTSSIEYERKSADETDEMPIREHVMVSICDTGVGIPGHLRERIFEPFFSTKPAGLGAGMGLAMAHGIVESHGGSIRFTSRVAAGTEFDVILPCAVASVELLQGENGMDDRGKIPQQILVIDDDEIVREMLKEMLSGLGYLPTCAESGFKGVGIFTTDHDRTDLIVLDMLMPGMDGPETLRRLQAVDSAVPILISSGYASNDSIQGVLDSGAVGFLKKPYTIRELSRMISESIRPRQKLPYGSLPIRITPATPAEALAR